MTERRVDCRVSTVSSCCYYYVFLKKYYSMTVVTPPRAGLVAGWRSAMMPLQWWHRYLQAGMGMGGMWGGFGAGRVGAESERRRKERPPRSQQIPAATGRQLLHAQLTVVGLHVCCMAGTSNDYFRASGGTED